MERSESGMKYNLIARPLIRHFIFVLSCSIFFNLPLSAQNSGLKDELAHSLSGTTVISTVKFAEKAAPPGDRSGCLVSTIIYPTNNEVAYRMDSGSTCTAIAAQAMQHSIDRGTSFEVSSVDLQDGWLDLNLKSATGEYARLRVMLGDGWQSKLDSSSIRAQLARVLILDQNPLPKQRTTTALVGFGETFNQKEHHPPAKGTQQKPRPTGIVFGNLGSTS
jgi:hypothetical protein